MIYWGGNPAECHPRHFTKYSLTQKGKFIPNGRKDRTMVLLDIRETPSVKAADIFLQVRPSRDFEVITTLRALIKGQRVDPQLVAETGLTLEQLQDLADRMKKARFGVMFFAIGALRLLQGEVGDPNFPGNWSWAPYAIVVVGMAALAALAWILGTRKRKATKP